MMETKTYSHILYNLRVESESYLLNPGTMPLPDLGINLTISDSKQDILLEKTDPKAEIQYQNSPVSDLLSLEAGAVFEINGCSYVLVPKAGVYFNTQGLAKNQIFAKDELQKRGHAYDGDGSNTEQASIFAKLAKLDKKRRILYASALAFAILGTVLALTKKDAAPVEEPQSASMEQASSAGTPTESNPAAEPTPPNAVAATESNQDAEPAGSVIQASPSPASPNTAQASATQGAAPAATAKKEEKAPKAAEPALSPEQVQQYKAQLQEIKLEAGFDPDSARDRLNELIEKLPKHSPLHQQATQMLKTF